MKKIIYGCVLVLVLIIILLTGKKIFFELVSSEKKVIVNNQNSKIVKTIKKCFEIEEDIKQIKYYDDFDGFNIYVYTYNDDEKFIHVERPNSFEKEIELYFKKIKKEYNKVNIGIFIFCINLEIYCICIYIKYFKEKKNI